MDPVVKSVLTQVFGIKTFRRNHVSMSVADLVCTLKKCIEYPREIDKFLLWRETVQGHTFWASYNEEFKESLVAGREVLNRALNMLTLNKSVEEFL